MITEKTWYTPFPNQGEIIRTIAKALDIKSSQKSMAKQLDDYAQDGDTNYELCSKMIKEIIYKPVRKYIDEDTAELLSLSITELLADYVQLVKKVSLDGISRDKALPLLTQHYFSWKASHFLTQICSNMDSTLSVNLVSSTDSATHVAYLWLDKNIEWWHKFYTSCNKEQKDKMSIWKKGKELPLITSIKNLSTWSKPYAKEKEWKQIKTLLLVARAIDWFKNSSIGLEGINDTRIHLWSISGTCKVENALEKLHVEGTKPLEPLFNTIPELYKIIFQCKEKVSGAQAESRKLLDEAKNVQLDLDPDGTSVYFLTWLEARWFLFSGKFDESLNLYKKAFKESLYVAGENQVILLKEALLIAAKTNDRAFLKQLKHQGITFGLFNKVENEGDYINKHSRSNSDVVADYEVKAWIVQLDKKFPSSHMFEGCEMKSSSEKSEPLILTGDNDVKDYIKPDYRYPNKKIKIGNMGRKLSMPQLVWFAISDQPEVVEKLLEKGASVDCCSESGDTPILMAVANMDITLPVSLDERCFNLLSTHEHKGETINRKTNKLKLLPLISAVNTGKPSVVKKLLEMGAKVDERGSMDNTTALCLCISLLSELKNIEKATNKFKQYMKYNREPEIQESIQRYAESSIPGSGGTTLNSTHALLNDPEINSITNDLADKRGERLKEFMTETAMREMAHILLTEGASPNSKAVLCSTPKNIHGYTPLMFAAELDEVELFERMLEKNGDPFQVYYHPMTGQEVDCWQIAYFFNAKKVQTVLEKRYPDDKPIMKIY